MTVSQDISVLDKTSFKPIAKFGGQKNKWRHRKEQNLTYLHANIHNERYTSVYFTAFPVSHDVADTARRMTEAPFSPSRLLLDLHQGTRHSGTIRNRHTPC